MQEEKEKTLFLKIIDNISDVAETFVVSVLLFLFVYAFLAYPEIVVGASMEKTLHGGERLIVERLSVRFNRLQRGDIIIFNPPGNDSIDFVKRVIGLPGDSLKIKSCKVYLVSGSAELLLDETYVDASYCTSYSNDKMINVPSDSYYVLGDNRENSADSRVFGFLKKERIGGRVILRFWPLSKISFFK